MLKRWSTRSENEFSVCSASLVFVASATNGFDVATTPRGNPLSSGATAWVRAGFCPAPVPTGSPAMMRRRASSLGTASVKVRPVFCFKPS